MDISYFKNALLSDAEDFYSWWVMQQNNNLSNFPEVLPKVEWFEQFITWKNQQ